METSPARRRRTPRPPPSTRQRIFQLPPSFHPRDTSHRCVEDQRVRHHPYSNIRTVTQPARRRRTPRPPPSTRQRIFQLSPSFPTRGTTHIAICDASCGYYGVHSPTCIEPFSPCTSPPTNLPPYTRAKTGQTSFRTVSPASSLSSVHGTMIRPRAA